jgi:hypothetical protein
MGIMNIATTNGVSQMKNIDAHIRSSNCPDQASRGSAVNELQDVLSKFPETRPSSVPALLDEKLIQVFEDAAA